MVKKIRKSSSSPTEEIDLHIKVPRSGRVIITAVTAKDGSSKFHQFTLPQWVERILEIIKARGNSPTKVASTLKETSRSTWLLIAIGLVLFLGTRLVHLEDFPPGFYSDEVTNAVRASDLIRDGFHDYYGNFLPTFFLNDNKFTLGTTVYLQIIPHLLFGNQIFFVRSVSVLLAALASLWMALTIMRSYKLAYGWTAIFILASTPAWFMYSRLAFETIAAASFYMGFIHYYLRFRQENRNYLYPSMVCAALSFYSYFPAQVIVPLTYLAFLFIDRKYFLQEWKKTLWSHLFLIVLIIPFARFLFYRPGSYGTILEQYNSFLAANESLLQKLMTFLANYLQGLNPFFWFNPNPSDYGWFEMRPYGYISFLLLPFFIYGLYILVKNFDQSEMRALLAAWCITPIASALTSIVITRMLIAIIPVAIITNIGFSRFLLWLQRLRINTTWLQICTSTILALSAMLLTRDVLTQSPQWIQDFGIDGIQWGAKQVFTKALELHELYPESHIRISGGWTWQADTLKLFFIPDEYPVETGNADLFLDQYKPEISDYFFILNPEDFQKTTSNPVIGSYQLLEIIPYPDGNPGFYVTKLAYAPDAQKIMADRLVEVTRLFEENAYWLGQQVVIRHTRLQEGDFEKITDGDPGTFLKTDEVNPLIIEVDFSQPVLMGGINAVIGSEELHLTLELNTTEGQFTFKEEFPGSAGQKTVSIAFNKEYEVKSFRYVQQDPYAVPQAIIHLWELSPLK